MQEAEEQDTCRICSAPAEPDQPLFHPCKCSGTIRYIHQDCLTTWLSHSKKKSCDVCKHPYSFTKVYAENMPPRLPLFLLLRKVVEQAFFTLVFSIRLVVVMFIWLAVLPLVTVWTWRMYFTVGDALAWWIADRPRPAEAEYSVLQYPPGNSTVIDRSSLAARFTRHPAWLAFWSDIFTGQIIASVIILSFIALFLLREWISQNARPGILEDEDDDIIRVALNGEAPQLPPVPDLEPALAPEEVLNEPLAPDVVAPAQPIPELVPTIDAPLALRPGTPERAPLVQLGALQDVPPRHRGTAPEGSYDADPTILNDHPSTLDEDTHTTLDAPAQRHRSLSDPQPAPAHLRPGLSLGSAGPGHWTQPNTPHSELTPPRRPPLPSVTLPSPALETAGGSSRLRSPLESPHLATYRAPEEIQADSARLADYFGEEPRRRSRSRSPSPTMEAAYDQYFQEPEAGPSGVAALGEEESPPGLLESEASSDEEEEGYNDYRWRAVPPAVDPLAEDPLVEDPLADDLFDDEFADDSDDDLGAIDGDEEDELEDLDIELDLEDDDEEDDDEDAGVLDLAAAAVPVGPNGPEAARDPHRLPAMEGAVPNGPALPEGNEELEANPEDDIDGILEAIGLRGPYYTIIQNAALMIFILDTALAIAIWVPFILGKTTALLSLYPSRVLEILHLPIKLIRIVTDPIVDSSVFLFSKYLLPALFLSGKPEAPPAPASTSERILSFVSSLYDKMVNFAMGFFNELLQSKAPESAPTPDTTYVDRVVSLLGPTEPHFAAFGKEVRIHGTVFHEQWHKLAVGQTTPDRMFALLLGYMVAALMVALYLNLLTIGNMRSAGRAVRSTVRQQLLVLKVASFILIELFLFPLGCGMVLDLCTIWLFAGTTFDSRISFFWQAPLTAIFYHWAAGTMFMYCFAILLSGCRAVIRPGAMWFIKDPQDHNSHPIRDILERPTLHQLRKIGYSGVMYSVVVIAVVCSVAGLMMLGSTSRLLPFRWKIREPLSSVPVDLLFLNFTLPYTMHYFRPKGPLKKAAKAVWVFLADELDLASYFFGGDLESEESRPRIRTWINNVLAERSGKDQGNYRRVPATDKVALGRDMSAVAAVTKTGEPVDDAAKELIRRQDAEAVKAKRDPKVDYMVVYMPSMFRWRVIALVTVVWLLGAVSAGLFVAGPILVGRGIFQLFVPQEVHDGYSFLVGFYLLWGCFLVTNAVDRLDKRRQRARYNRPRGDLFLLAAKRGLLWTTKISYMIVMFGIILPPLLAIVIELYILLPLRFLFQPDLVPTIRLVDSWALGLMYTKIVVQVFRFRRGPQEHRVADGVQHIIFAGWSNPDPWRVSRDVIGPLLVGLGGMIFMPLGIFKLVVYLFPSLRALDNRFVFQHVYSGIFVVIGAISSASGLTQRLASWSQTIRDKEFLVELRLRNHEPDVKDKPETIPSPPPLPP